MARHRFGPPRVGECPEVRVQRVLVHPHVLIQGKPNRIDPDEWRPLIMLFSHPSDSPTVSGGHRPRRVSTKASPGAPDIDRGRTSDLTPLPAPAVRPGPDLGAHIAPASMAWT